MLVTCLTAHSSSVKSVKFSDDADNIRYDPVGWRVDVGYGSGALGIIDRVQSRKRLTRRSALKHQREETSAELIRPAISIVRCGSDIVYFLKPPKSARVSPVQKRFTSWKPASLSHFIWSSNGGRSRSKLMKQPPLLTRGNISA